MRDTPDIDRSLSRTSSVTKPLIEVCALSYYATHPIGFVFLRLHAIPTAMLCSPIKLPSEWCVAASK